MPVDGELTGGRLAVAKAPDPGRDHVNGLPGHHISPLSGTHRTSALGAPTGPTYPAISRAAGALATVRDWVLGERIEAVRAGHDPDGHPGDHPSGSSRYALATSHRRRPAGCSGSHRLCRCRWRRPTVVFGESPAVQVSRRCGSVVPLGVSLRAELPDFVVVSGRRAPGARPFLTLDRHLVVLIGAPTPIA